MRSTDGDFAEGAQRLLAHEGASAERPEGVPVAAAIACEQLIVAIAEFVGQGGARALWHRALVLAGRRHRWLEGALTGGDVAPWPALRTCLAANEPHAWDGSSTILETILTLFSGFVGAGLARQILHLHRPDAFPLQTTGQPK